MTEDEDFTKAFEGFGEDDKPATNESETSTPTETRTNTENSEEKTEKKEEKSEGSSKDAPADESAGESEKKEDEQDNTPEEKKEPVVEEAPETPKPLTKDDVQEVVSSLLNTERSSSKELDTTTQEVIEAFYPDGLSNVLVDEKTGKELLTPADVVEASGDTMSIEEATRWLMNEQFKLDQSVAKIKDDARAIAETNLRFKRDSVAVMAKYEPLFKAYPQIQKKVYEKLMKQVKVDKEKGIILSAPDVMEHYDDYLEPYQQAYELGTNQPATNPVPEEKPEPPKPTAEDRMDESGDGSSSGEVDDPNDFAQQVKKELAI